MDTDESSDISSDSDPVLTRILGYMHPRGSGSNEAVLQRALRKIHESYDNVFGRPGYKLTLLTHHLTTGRIIDSTCRMALPVSVVPLIASFIGYPSVWEGMLTARDSFRLTSSCRAMQAGKMLHRSKNDRYEQLRALQFMVRFLLDGIALADSTAGAHSQIVLVIDDDDL